MEPAMTTDEAKTVVSDLMALADQMERHDYPDDAETCRNAVSRIATLEAQVAALIAEPTEEMVAPAKAAIMSYLFGACQPDRGDVFSWVDDHVDEIAKAALTAFLRRRSQP